jgi:hypothetical protein
MMSGTRLRKQKKNTKTLAKDQKYAV